MTPQLGCARHRPMPSLSAPAAALHCSRALLVLAGAVALGEAVAAGLALIGVTALAYVASLAVTARLFRGGRR